MSTTPVNATVNAVYGQLYNFSGVIKLSTSGNPLTGGLTGLAATISKNDGAFTATTNSPVEIATNSGYFSLDLTATEMSANKVLVNVVATNSNAVYFGCQINTLVLSQFTGRADAQTPLRIEQIQLETWYMQGVNGGSTNGAQEIILNPDGSVHFQSSIVQGQTSGTASRFM